MSEANASQQPPQSEPQQQPPAGKGLARELADVMDNPTSQPTPQPPAQQRQQQQQEPPPESNDPTLKAIQGMIEQAMKPYTEKLAKVEGTNAAREAERRGSDAREQYIMEYNNGIPPKLMRMFLPATEDKKALAEAGRELSDLMKAYVMEGVRRGHFTVKNVSGDLPFVSPGADFGGAARGGGKVVSPLNLTSGAKTGVQALAEALDSEPR